MQIHKIIFELEKRKKILQVPDEEESHGKRTVPELQLEGLEGTQAKIQALSGEAGFNTSAGEKPMARNCKKLELSYQEPYRIHILKGDSKIPPTGLERKLMS